MYEDWLASGLKGPQGMSDSTYYYVNQLSRERFWTFLIQFQYLWFCRCPELSDL